MRYTYYDRLFPDVAKTDFLYGKGIVLTSDQISQMIDQGAVITQDQTTATTISNSAQGLENLANLHSTLLQGQGLISTGSGGGGTNDPTRTNPISVVSRPWVEQPDGSEPYDFESGVSLPVVGSSATVVSFQVPAGYDGIINAFSWNFVGGGFTENSGDIQVQLLRNGAPIRNYDNILVQKGTTNIPRPISALRVYSNQIISMVVNHLANNTLNGSIVGSLLGYFYPSLS